MYCYNRVSFIVIVCLLLCLSVKLHQVYVYTGNNTVCVGLGPTKGSWNILPQVNMDNCMLKI